MPSKLVIPSMLVGSIHDVLLPPPPRARARKRPVALQLRVQGPTGYAFEWCVVHKELQSRIIDLVNTEQLPMGKTCAFMADEKGALLGFIVVRCP